MTKLINKDDLTFENNRIVKDDEIVGLPVDVVLQLHKLELMVQQYDYLTAQPSYSPAPSLDGFERKTALKSDRPYVNVPDTPVTDNRVEEAMAFMAEVDKVNEAADVNNMIDRFGALIDWLAAVKFVEGSYTGNIDTPVLGNPLVLTPGDVAAILTNIIMHPVIMED